MFDSRLKNSRDELAPVLDSMDSPRLHDRTKFASNEQDYQLRSADTSMPLKI